MTLRRTFPVDAFQEAWVRHFWVIAETRLELKPGALELLDALDRLRLPRAIATSSSRRTIERHLTAYDLLARFNEIVGHGDYEHGKPSASGSNRDPVWRWRIPIMAFDQRRRRG